MRIIIVCLVLGLMMWPSAASAQAPQGKLIEFGWDRLSVSYVRDHLAEMEKMPFDGITLRLGEHDTTYPQDSSIRFIYNTWTGRPQNPKTLAKVEEDIKILAGLKFKRFTDNFIVFWAYPGSVDWFDDEAFKHVLDSWRLAARAVKQTGFRGILFDHEPYAAPYEIFCYDKQKNKGQYTFEQYRKKVYQRARQIMAVIKEECPTITILFTIGNEYALTYRNKLPEVTYGLLPDFIDGFLDKGGPTVTIVDGDEMGYGLRLEPDFKTHLQLVKEKCAVLSRNPMTYPRRITAGIGLWLDCFSSKKENPWYNQPLDFNKNYYTPDEFAHAVHSALKYFKYVWIYSERGSWWPDPWANPKFPYPMFSQAYIDALAQAKQKSVPVPPKRQLDTCRWLPEQSDYVAMTPFWEANRPVTALPAVWKFRLDAKDEGEKAMWFREDLKDGAWDSIIVPEFWEHVSNEYAGYDGAAWYRVQFKVPAWAKGKKLTLLFAGVDEEAKVWLNGTLLGEHSKGPEGWNKPFSFDVTDKLRLDGKENQITVRVLDTMVTGGIWRSVYVITPMK